MLIFRVGEVWITALTIIRLKFVCSIDFRYTVPAPPFNRPVAADAETIRFEVSLPVADILMRPPAPPPPICVVG
jgi:hypothetical protein